MSNSILLGQIFPSPTGFFSFSLHLVYHFHLLTPSLPRRHPPRAMAAAATAAEAPAAVILLGEDHVALGRIVEVASLQRQGGKGGEARVGGRRHEQGSF